MLDRVHGKFNWRITTGPTRFWNKAVAFTMRNHRSFENSSWFVAGPCRGLDKVTRQMLSHESGEDQQQCTLRYVVVRALDMSRWPACVPLHSLLLLRARSLSSHLGPKGWACVPYN